MDKSTQRDFLESEEFKEYMTDLVCDLNTHIMALFSKRDYAVVHGAYETMKRVLRHPGTKCSSPKMMEFERDILAKVEIARLRALR
jgi:hypothetical protein